MSHHMPIHPQSSSTGNIFPNASPTSHPNRIPSNFFSMGTILPNASPTSHRNHIPSTNSSTGTILHNVYPTRHPSRIPLTIPSIGMMQGMASPLWHLRHPSKVHCHFYHPTATDMVGSRFILDHLDVLVTSNISRSAPTTVTLSPTICSFYCHKGNLCIHISLILFHFLNSTVNTMEWGRC